MTLFTFLMPKQEKTISNQNIKYFSKDEKYFDDLIVRGSYYQEENIAKPKTKITIPQNEKHKIIIKMKRLPRC